MLRVVREARDRHVFACTSSRREGVTFHLPFRRNGVMNRHAPTRRGKGYGETNMTNAETNTAATVAEQGATVAPRKARSKKNARPKKGAPKGQKTAKSGKANAAAAKKKTKLGKKASQSARAKPSSAPRAESKGAKILEMIGRAKGATLAEIMKAISWQAHSVRGFLSIAAKKHSLPIQSSKNEAGDRVYKIGK